MAKNVVGLFDNMSDAHGAVQELTNAGFTSDNISIVANNASGDTVNYDTAGSEAADGAGAGAVGGAVLGFGIGYGIIFVFNSSTVGLALGIALGMLVFFAFTIVASVINSYTSTAYHTCLYLWARNVEKAQTAGQPIQVAAPAPLAAVLG